MTTATLRLVFLTLCLAAGTLAGAAAGTSRGTTPPRPADFPCALTFRGPPAPVDLASHPEARTFRTELRAQARRPADFAGCYVAASWGCGSPCQQWALIDVRDGKVYFAPFTTAVGARFSLASRLFVADPPEEITRSQAAGAASSDLPLTPSYWEWQEDRKRFVEIK